MHTLFRAAALQENNHFSRVQKRLVHIISQRAEQHMSERLHANMPMPCSDDVLHPATKQLDINRSWPRSYVMKVKVAQGRTETSLRMQAEEPHGNRSIPQSGWRLLLAWGRRIPGRGWIADPAPHPIHQDCTSKQHHVSHFPVMHAPAAGRPRTSSTATCAGLTSLSPRWAVGLQGCL